MKFCTECGQDLKGSTKFCPECGFNLQVLSNSNVIQQKNTETTEIIEDQTSHSIDEKIIQKTTKELGNNLEDAVEKIYKDRGYETLLRQKMRGTSGQFNEIDVLVRRNKFAMAIECKNYDENRKVGIQEIRNFVAKLDDLDIKRGLFVTSSDFSSDAIGWAQNNPSEKQVDLWDGSTLMEQWKTVVLGRGGNQTVKIENCIQPHGDFNDFTNITLHNSDRVNLRRCDMIFHPFYIVRFDLNEEFKTPDKQIHTLHNSGEYYVDGLSGEILYYNDENGYVPVTSDDEEKQFIKEIESFPPVGEVVLVQKSGSQVIKIDPSISASDSQFRVRIYASKDNQARIPYEIKVSKDVFETREFLHKPDPNKIITKSRIIYVPKVDVEFESKEYTYSRVIFPASEIWIRDDIAKCKHFIGSKHTFAVCEVCGIAKCEKDILVDDKDYCYCKKHASEELKEKNKGSSISEKLKSKFRRQKR